MNSLKKFAYIVFIFILFGTLCGCSRADTQNKTDNISESDKTDALPENTEKYESVNEPEEMPEDKDNITPYQFLNLFCANADETTFSYVVTYPQDNHTETGTFQKMGDTLAVSFTTKNMNGNTVSVREIEKNNKVHYIMDNSRIIKTYNAPAEDFLLYKMMEAANTEPVQTLEQDGYFMYEYDMPFEQDDNIQIRYCFFMKGGALKKLTISYGDNLTSVYEFSEFWQNIVDSAVFEYPEGYNEVNFDYVYDGEYMPPWWETYNDK